MLINYRLLFNHEYLANYVIINSVFIYLALWLSVPLMVLKN